MMGIQNKKEYNLIERLNSDLMYAKKTANDVENLNSQLLNTEEIIASINGIQKQCTELMEDYKKLIDTNLLKLIKTGNVILVEATDAISYNENRYYYIKEKIKEGVNILGLKKIQTDLIVVGHGDSGSWISYEEDHYIEPTELLGLLKTYSKHGLSSLDVMEKYIQFTQTIPE